MEGSFEGISDGREEGEISGGERAKGERLKAKGTRRKGNGERRS